MPLKYSYDDEASKFGKYSFAMPLIMRYVERGPVLVSGIFVPIYKEYLGQLLVQCVLLWRHSCIILCSGQRNQAVSLRILRTVSLRRYMSEAVAYWNQAPLHYQSQTQDCIGVVTDFCGVLRRLFLGDGHSLTVLHLRPALVEDRDHGDPSMAAPAAPCE